MTVAELANVAYFQPRRCPPGMERARGQRFTAAAPMIWANATHVCTCEVDVATGRQSPSCGSSSARTAAA